MDATATIPSYSSYERSLRHELTYEELPFMTNASVGDECVACTFGDGAVLPLNKSGPNVGLPVSTLPYSDVAFNPRLPAPAFAT